MPAGNEYHSSAGKLRVYRPNQRHDMGLIATWAVMGRNIFSSRELIWQLFKRNFLATYKKSFLGVTWIFISPLVGIISWIFLNSTGMLDPGDLDIPYPVYVLVGSTVWGLFAGFFNSAKATLSAGSSLILQVNYPHEALLFTQTAQHLASFTISFAMNIAVLLLFNIIPGWRSFFFPSSSSRCFCSVPVSALFFL
jgi:lipopolysaccharide transport system permease protein